MSRVALTETDTKWSHEFNTLRRENLFRNPPKDRSAYPLLADAVRPHIDSFNAIFEKGGLISEAIKDIGTKTFLDGDERSGPAGKNRLSVRILDIFVEKSMIPANNKHSTRNREILPAECRERHCTYRGRMSAKLEYRVNDGEPHEFVRDLGQIPLMMMSNRCHLEKDSPAQLVQKKEESEELGGYFVVNGIEKMIRLLVVNRRNFPMAIIRPSFKGRGKTYTEFGMLLRSVRPDATSQTNVLHYLDDGNVTFRFSWRKNEFLVPVMMILKALTDTNDREIFELLVGPAGSKGADNTFLTDRVELLLRTYKNYGLYTKSKTRAYLGSKFRVVLGVPDNMSDYDVGTEFLRKIVLPHLGNVDVTDAQDADKFRMLLFMVRKLYALVAGDCAIDNPDAIQNQEILLGGFLFGMIIKERLEDLISTNLKLSLRAFLRKSPANSFVSEEFKKEFPVKIFAKTNEQIGAALEYFMSTGNLVSPTGLDLQQTSGFTVVAEKINFLRFISHFRAVHRGAFFAQLKTTTVRKLLPESWGFMCPVHTPDGSPCGLLNHLSHKCKILTHGSDASAIPKLLVGLGVVSTSSASTEESVVVSLDGKILGYCTPKQS